MARLKDYLFEAAEEWALQFPEKQFYDRIDQFLNHVMNTGTLLMKQDNKITLSKAQAQFLKAMMSSYLSVLEDDTKMYREACSDYYVLADKDKGEEGEYYFKCLNKARNTLRNIRVEKAKVSEIQRVLKQLAK